MADHQISPPSASHPHPIPAISHESWDQDPDLVLPSGPLDINVGSKVFYNMDASSLSSRADSIFSHVAREGSLEPLSSDDGKRGFSGLKDWEEEEEDWEAEMGINGDANESADSSKGDTIRAKFGLGDFKSPTRDGNPPPLPGSSETEVKENTIKGLPVNFSEKTERLIPKLSTGSSAVEADDEDFESSFDLPAAMSKFQLSPQLKKERSSTAFPSSTLPFPQTPTTPTSPQPSSSVVTSASNTRSSIPGLTTCRSRSSSLSSMELDSENDDEKFFEDIILPPFSGFRTGKKISLGGSSAGEDMDGDEFDIFGAKIDLQSYLRRKMERRAELDLPLPPLTPQAMTTPQARPHQQQQRVAKTSVGSNGSAHSKSPSAGSTGSRPALSRKRPATLTKTYSNPLDAFREAPSGDAEGLIFGDVKLGTDRMREASVNRRNRVNLMNQMERSRGRYNSASARLGQSNSTPILDSRRSGVRSPVSGFRKPLSEGRDIRPRSVTGMASTISPTLGSLKAKGLNSAMMGRRSPIPSSFRNPPISAPLSGPGRGRTLSTTGKSTPPPAPSSGAAIGRGLNPGLRKRPSTSNLTLSSGNSSGPSLTRKRSMPSLSINAGRDGKVSPSLTALPMARLRTTTGTTSTIGPSFYTSGSQSATGFGFAAPTLSSMSKQRRVQSDDGSDISDPHHGRSTSLGQFSTTSSTRPATPSSTLTQPTASSLAKARPPSRAGTIPNLHVLKRPKRVRNYGDGSELDAFDDLPTNRDEERKFLGSSGNSKTLKRSTGIGKGASENATKISTSKIGDRKASAVGSVSTIGKKKRVIQSKKPQLIRSLNASSLAKVQGEMLWNPIAHRWEGNESIMRDFERALGTSVRPALITNFSAASTLSPSPTRVGSPSTIASAKLPNGVRVVGNMRFDPVQMKWFSNEGEGEDDLDELLLDEDDEVDEWEEGENARMLKNRASFVSDVSTTSESGEEDLFWKECEEADARWKREFEEGGWSIEGTEGRRVRGERDHLWDIRNLILGR